MPEQKQTSFVASARDERKQLYNEDAERGVLGAILLDSELVLDFCIEKQIDISSFYFRNHQIIYGAMLDMHRENRAIDALTLSDKLHTQGKLDEIGGSIFLNQLLDSIPTAAHAEYYIDIIRQKHLLRRISECARKAENTCYTSEQSADAILGKVEQDFFDLTTQRHSLMTPWPKAVKDTMQTIEFMLTHKGISGIPSGFADLDAKLHGFHPGEMIVLAGRPGMGKTSLATNIVEHVALGTVDQAGKSVAIFSLEMPSEQLIMRMLGTYAEISPHKIASGFLSDTDHGLLAQAADALTKAPIYLDDSGTLDILELRARARRMKKKHGIELFIIDYLQLLHTSEHRNESRQVEISSISGSLKGMAKELKVPVIVVSQLNRAPESRERSGKPRLADLRDSGAIEQDADVVCLLRRPSLYAEDTGKDKEEEDKNKAILNIAKQRNGPTGTIELTFLDEIMRFENFASETQYGEGNEISSSESEI